MSYVGIIKDTCHIDTNAIQSKNIILIDDIYTKSVNVDEESIISIYDGSFPVINKSVKNKGDKPYLLFYKGNLNLFNDLNKNIAVIGLVNPNNKVINRENDVVKKLTDNDLAIVSGLAKGCDSIAHKSCLDNGGKTIAILPSPLSKIYPVENK